MWFKILSAVTAILFRAHFIKKHFFTNVCISKQTYHIRIYMYFFKNMDRVTSAWRSIFYIYIRVGLTRSNVEVLLFWVCFWVFMD